MLTKITKGFTLVELIIAIAIVAILASLAFPAYQNHVTRVRASEAQTHLLDIMQRQRKFYSERNRFTTDFTELFTQATLTELGEVTTEQGFYTISSIQCEDQPLTACVDLVATPLAGTVGTVFRYNSLNQKRPLDKW